MAWSVAVDGATRFVNKHFDGHSSHAAVSKPVLPEELLTLPVDFSIAVVLGRSASGKTSALAEIAARLGADTCSAKGDVASFKAGIAVCSDKRLDAGNGPIDRLSWVGLNRVPSWLRPVPALSNGEQARVNLALRLKSKALLDDFGATVDFTTSCSMSAGLVRLVQKEALHHIVIATTCRDLVPWLCPDVVIDLDAKLLLQSPSSAAERRPRISLHSDLRLSLSDGWNGEVDKKPVVDRGLAHVTYEESVDFTKLTSKVRLDRACEEVADAFELEFNGKTETHLPTLPRNFTRGLPSRWIGVVLGASGSGKSTALSKAFGPDVLHPRSWPDRLCVISAVCKASGFSPELASKLFETCDLPEHCWLKPFSVLSSGEKSRAQIAMAFCLAKGRGKPIVLDEFTTGLDRDCARRLCISLAQYTRSGGIGSCGLVVAGVHTDVLQWLHPDWLLNTDAAKFQRFEANGESNTSSREAVEDNREGQEHSMDLFATPVLNFTLRRLDQWPRVKEAWDVFKGHHYRQGAFPSATTGFLLRDDSSRVAAFVASSPFPGASRTGVPGMREARLVVMPQYQGLGLGPRVSDLVAEAYFNAGKPYFSVTSHFRLGEYRMRSSRWTACRFNLKWVPAGKSMAESCRKMHGTLKTAGKNTEPKVYRRSYRHQFVGHGADVDKKLQNSRINGRLSVFRKRGEAAAGNAVKKRPAGSVQVAPASSKKRPAGA